jgi:hypothetical protein
MMIGPDVRPLEEAVVTNSTKKKGLRILTKYNPEAVLLANGPCSYVEVGTNAVNEADRERLHILGWTAIGNWWGFMEAVGQRHQPE